MKYRIKKFGGVYTVQVKKYCVWRSLARNDEYVSTPAEFRSVEAAEKALQEYAREQSEREVVVKHGEV